MLASCGLDEVIRLWDVHAGEFLKVFEGHISTVNSVTFISRETLVSSSHDGTIKVWNVKTGKCLKTLTDKPYEGMNITGVKGLTEAEKATLKALGAVESE